MSNKRYTTKELWNSLKRLYKKKEERLTIPDIENADFTASYRTYFSRIGDIHTINKGLGAVTQDRHTTYSTRRLLQDLKEVIFAFGEDFTVEFFNSLGLAKYQTYLARFGSIEEAIKLAKKMDYKVKKKFII